MKILLIPAERIDPVDRLSLTTMGRCLAGLSVWTAGGYDRLLLTGGIFLSTECMTRPAAEIMRDWFVEHGVDPTVILVESASLDTYENVDLGLVTLRRMGYAEAEVTVLTQYQHAIRFWLTFLLAHHRLVRLIMIRQKEMRWRNWLAEWLLFIPCHLLDWRGRSEAVLFHRRICRIRATPD